MRILITNDDGIAAEGIRVLSRVLGERHEVWVVAPDSNRSGVSHGITMYHPLYLEPTNQREYSCSGLPADCVMSALNGLLPEPPDLVLSGINHGANLGTDIMYSGTAAAARQAAFVGIPGIAVSLVHCPRDAALSDGTLYWEPLSRFILQNLDVLVSLCDRDVFVNVNAPSLPEYRGARITDPARRSYLDVVTFVPEGSGTLRREFESSRIETDGGLDSDWRAVQDGFVSVSRIRAQPVDAPLPDSLSVRFQT